MQIFPDNHSVITLAALSVLVKVAIEALLALVKVVIVAQEELFSHHTSRRFPGGCLAHFCQHQLDSLFVFDNSNEIALCPVTPSGGWTGLLGGGDGVKGGPGEGNRIKFAQWPLNSNCPSLNIRTSSSAQALCTLPPSPCSSVHILSSILIVHQMMNHHDRVFCNCILGQRSSIHRGKKA